MEKLSSESPMKNLKEQVLNDLKNKIREMNRELKEQDIQEALVENDTILEPEHRRSSEIFDQERDEELQDEYETMTESE